METPVPYFSDISANQGPQHTAPAQTYNTVKKFPAFQPHLGLPCRKNFSSVGCRHPTKQQPHFLASGDSCATERKDHSASILAQVETPAIVEKQFTEINQPNFLSLATQNTFEGLAKAAEKKARQLNPLSNAKKQKRRKLDIFDL